VKIIPFSVPGAALARALGGDVAGAVRVAPFLPMRVGVVSTLLQGLKPSIVAKTLLVLEARLAAAGASIASETRARHETGALVEAIHAVARSCDLVIVFGASAITDRRDVIPAAIVGAGGMVEHLGMPVDPGNLLLLGTLPVGRGGSIPVIGAPGCARSPKENGFDFVLRRLLAGLPVTSADLRGMGVGGLLNEIVTRPQPRAPGDAGKSHD
jgi:molybdenum cofactor cytidylyltransferase